MSSETGKRRNAAIPMGRATLLSLPISVLLLLMPAALYGIFWGAPSITAESFGGPLMFAVTLAVGIILHEGLHAAGWKFAGRISWNAIRFGVNWKVLAPYAHCRVPISARAYRIGIVLPGLVLGILPVTAGLARGEPVVTFWGTLFLAAASGDLLGLLAIRSVPASTRVSDHPTQLGCEVIEE